MAWQSTTTLNGLTWEYDTSLNGLRISDSSMASQHLLYYINSTVYEFSQNYNYQFVTSTDNFRRNISINNAKKLKIIAPWGDEFDFENNNNISDTTRPQINNHDIVWYSSPSSNVNTPNLVRYSASWNDFGEDYGDGTPVITNFKLNKIDWFIDGWALSGDSVLYRGWYFNQSDNSIRWVNSNSIIAARNPLSLNSNFDPNENRISKFISYPFFNLKFDVDATLSAAVDVYLSGNETNLNNAQFLGRIEGSLSGVQFYNLLGNQWLVFVADHDESVSNRITIENIIIDGAYHPNNNNQFILDGSSLIGSSDATYSVVTVTNQTSHSASNSLFGATGSPGFFSNLYGEVINLGGITSNFGNGLFKAGVWENGVWNSGWRVDEFAYDFFDILSIVQVNTTNNTWRIQIKGSQNSVSNFEIGDKISIGNIIGIDINEERRILRGYYTIINKTLETIIIELINNFPLRRIEKDSDNHKIKVTKNVWLNGAFFNGYFEGVWNNGLFKGFPFITEMYNSHWIDGYFDGGHFFGEYKEFEFTDTFLSLSTSPNTLGLTGLSTNDLEPGDKIEIKLNGTSSTNTEYNGEAEVIEVIDNNSIIINRTFIIDVDDESGIIFKKTGTGLIQHFNFKDNNVADKTTNDNTNNLQEVYNYNSWIDVKYLTQSASNLNRNQINIANPFNDFEYSELNLYGFITEDVLSSESIFRNSYDLNNSNFSLGTKYKIYEDFLGPISEFNEPFSTVLSMDNFYDNGWTYSPTSGYIINRTSDEKMRISNVPVSLFTITKLDNTNINIDKRRYSLIEFDLEYDSISDSFSFNNNEPFVWFYNLTDDNFNDFPISDFVYHTRTNGVKKYEYFYNRRSLDMFLLNGDSFTASFDNIKFYEVDMIPFFQYTTSEYVNSSIQVPYQGIAPDINYDDNGFSFISTLDIRLDSLSTQQTLSVPTPQGGGTLGGLAGGGLFI